MVARKTLKIRAIYERFHNMIVYPDNNIIIDHEKQIKALPISESIKYVYSYVHLNELQEAKNNLSSLKDSRLATIAELTNNRYVINHHHHLTISEISPAYLYDILENPIIKTLSSNIHKASEDWKVDANPKLLYETLGITKKEINNYPAPQIEEKYGGLIHHFIDQTCYFEQEKFISGFNILDALGFWQDKVKKGSTMNRLYDANHAYFASICDYFLTDDRNTRKKANCIYKMFGYKTKAISYEEFTKGAQLY